MLECNQNYLTTPIDRSVAHNQAEREKLFADELHAVAKSTWLNVMLFSGEVWGHFQRGNDYYDLIYTKTENIRPFQTLEDAAAFIKKTAHEVTSGSLDQSRLADILHTPNIWRAMHESRRDTLADQKKTIAHESVPFTPFEVYLYTSILNGTTPWKQVQSFEKNLIEAITINPTVSMQLIESLGIDMVLPAFPPIDSRARERIDCSLNQLSHQSPSPHDGAWHISTVLHMAGVSTKQPEESPEAYLGRIVRVLPGLEEYVHFDLAPNQNQQPEYYMQLLLGYCYFGIHRRLQHNEANEAIASLIVRNGIILGYSINEPIAETPYFTHTERITVARARGKSGDPSDVFSDADIYVSVEPCGECAGFLRTLNFHALYTGPRTKQGGDTVHKYFTRRIPDEDCPTGDVYAEMGLPYYPMPKVVQFNLLAQKFKKLIEEGQDWQNFIAKKLAAYA